MVRPPPAQDRLCVNLVPRASIPARLPATFVHHAHLVRTAPVALVHALLAHLEHPIPLLKPLFATRAHLVCTPLEVLQFALRVWLGKFPTQRNQGAITALLVNPPRLAMPRALHVAPAITRIAPHFSFAPSALLDTTLRKEPPHALHATQALTDRLLV